MARYYPNGSNRKRTERESERQKEINDTTTDYIDEVVDYSKRGLIDSPYHLLFEDGKLRNEQDYWFYSILDSIPGISGYLRAKGQYTDLVDYMKNYNLDWSDLYPWRIGNNGVGSLTRSTINFVGDMVKELYS